MNWWLVSEFYQIKVEFKEERSICFCFSSGRPALQRPGHIVPFPAESLPLVTAAAAVTCHCCRDTSSPAC